MTAIWKKIQNLKLRNLVRVFIGNKILLIKTCWNRVCDKSTHVLLAIYTCMNIKMLACPAFQYNVVSHYRPVRSSETGGVLLPSKWNSSYESLLILVININIMFFNEMCVREEEKIKAK